MLRTALASQICFLWILTATVIAQTVDPVSTRPLGTDESIPISVQTYSDIAYGSASNQKLDVYSPSNARQLPVILMVHGGGWRRGDKAASGVVKNKVSCWVQAGYVFISINYRLLPDANPFQQAEDVAKALAFAQKNAKLWGGDPSRFILMGHSAGAHLVALVTTHPSIAKSQGVEKWLGTVCLDSAALNVVKIMKSAHLRLYDEAFGKDQQFWQEVSPILQIKSAPPPILLVYSTRRPESQSQSKDFAHIVQSFDGKAILLPEDLSHRQINVDLGLPSTYTDQVSAFIRQLVVATK